MKKPVVLVVMDGVGETPNELGNMVAKATTPTLDAMKEKDPFRIIKAHGTAVGLPTDDDMGNSEVGHNALGCGQIYSQGAKLVNESIESGKIYESATWKKLTDGVKASGGALHFIGLLSDGNVHSNISHLLTMLEGSEGRGREEGPGAYSAGRAGCAGDFRAGLCGSAGEHPGGAERRDL